MLQLGLLLLLLTETSSECRLRVRERNLLALHAVQNKYIQRLECFEILKEAGLQLLLPEEAASNLKLN